MRFNAHCEPGITKGVASSALSSGSSETLCAQKSMSISAHDPARSRNPSIRRLDARAQPHNLGLPLPDIGLFHLVLLLRHIPLHRPRYRDRPDSARPLPSARPDLDADEQASFRRARPSRRSRIPRTPVISVVRSLRRPVWSGFKGVESVGKDVVVVFREGEAAERAGPPFACFAARSVSGYDEQAEVDRGFAAVCRERG